ncbi:MAG: hypothetical protein R3Y09_02680 [Clostridia bacterium]
MKKVRIGTNLGVTLFFLISLIVNTPNLNPMYIDGAFTWLFVISVYVVLNSFSVLSSIHVEPNSNGGFTFDIDKHAKGFKRLITILLVLWGLYFLANIASSPLFNSKAYRDQLGTPETTVFSEDIQALDLSQVPIVDQELAKSLADKKLGENPGVGSQVNLGEPVIQQVNGELVWVVPLEHSGFFKWLKNIDGSAGYIMVSATNQQDIEFVDSAIKYQPNSYFFDDITRYVRIMKGQLFAGLTDYSFEIDDEGNPYWIITTYANKWLFALPEATGILVLNAQTGELDKYDTDNIPSWVDRVQPESFVMTQINNQGEYVHGIFNFSNQDKFQSSSGEIIIYNDGNCYLFTGLTSVGSDESAIGFIMVDMVTKESKIYQMSGATEYAAQLSAEGKVQQYGYSASFPIIINHNGIASYFMTLKDNSGLIKQYAFVSVSDITSVGVGESIAVALRDYNNALGTSNSFVQPEGDEIEITGNIVRFANETYNNTLSYKFIIDSVPDKIFSADYDISDELAITIVGDEVNITYHESESGLISATTFDNLEFTQ